MPRVHTKTRNRGGKKAYTCSKCGEEIVAGQSYHEWEFRYGGVRRRHASCGYPRQSELTQSKMAEVYAAQEDVEDLILGDGWTDEDVKEAMQNAAERIREVASEYETAAESFGNAGENQERYEALDAYADDVERFDIPDRDGESDDEWREKINDEVANAFSNCPY